MALKEQQSLEALTRHVDDEKANRVIAVRQLPEDAEFGDEVFAGGELYKYLVDGWYKIETRKVATG